MNKKQNVIKNKDNNIFQKIKSRIFQENDKKIVVVQKGKKKGNYILEETIGEGAFAKVKLGKHIQTGEKVAIKILNKQKIYNFDIKKVKKEINILQRLKHKNIIQLYEIMETKNNLYIVMEYCEGKELFEYIVERKHLTEREACRYFQQMINGVEYLHLSNVTHRDLKPENLLLDNKKRILISDFGLSILSKNYNELLSTPCGTPSYAPPEMLKGKKYNGIFSDIWSCGIILYTMLVGNLPCSESKEELVYQNIITHNFYYPENLSDDAIDLIEHLLKINPKERYNFDEIKAHPWFNILTPKLRPGIVFEVHKIPIDPKILDKAKEMGYDQKKVEESVSKSKYDSFSAVYYLILKKFKKDGINSISDLFSDEYINYLKKSKNWIIPSKINDPLFKDYEVESLDNLEDEIRNPNESSNELSDLIQEDENKNINNKDDNTNIIFVNNNNEDASVGINSIIFKRKDFDNNFSDDKIINSMEINFDSNNNNIKIKNINIEKEVKTPKKKTDKKKIFNLKMSEKKIDNRIKIKNNINTNYKNNGKNNLFNVKNKKKPFSIDKIIKKRILNEKERGKENVTTNNKNNQQNKINTLNSIMNNNAFISNDAKTIEVKSPKYTKINKNINIICSPDKIINKYNNKKLSLYENIIFDNINELEAESKFLTQTSNILDDNITKKNSILNFKVEENNSKNKKNKLKASPFRSKTNINTPCLSFKRNKKDFSESENNSINCVKNKNRPYYPIRIKKRKKKMEEKEILLSEELNKDKKEEILNKIKEEEKNFNEELKSIDNIHMLNPIINFNEKSCVGQIAEKLIKSTIFSKYLTGNKKIKNSLKVDLENQFYILQKYKNIIGLIERMRNKIFTKKINDFNFYTFDEYLNDDNDKIFVKSLLQIPYFNSFIQKAKNTLCQKEMMTKRAYSKNIIFKPHKFNLNKSLILTSHLSTYANNLYYFSRDYQKYKKRVSGIKKLNINLSFTPIKNNSQIYTTESNSYLYRKITNTSRYKGKKYEISAINRNKSFSQSKEYNLNKSYNYKNIKKTPIKSSLLGTKKIIDSYINMHDSTFAHKNKLKNRNYMKNISEDEESILSSSYSSINESKKKYNNINKKSNSNEKSLFTNNKNILISRKYIDEEEEINNIKMNDFNYPLKKNNKSTKAVINTSSNINNKISNRKDKINNQTINKRTIIVQNKEEEESINKNNTSNKKNNINNNYDNLQEIKQLLPIDLNYILFLPLHIIFDKSKKYFKKYGYFYNEKNYVIKANKGSTNIIIRLYKLPYLSDGNIYYSVKIKSKDLKKDKLFIKELISNLRK